MEYIDSYRVEEYVFIRKMLHLKRNILDKKSTLIKYNNLEYIQVLFIFINWCALSLSLYMPTYSFSVYSIYSNDYTNIYFKTVNSWCGSQVQPYQTHLIRGVSRAFNLYTTFVSIYYQQKTHCIVIKLLLDSSPKNGPLSSCWPFLCFTFFMYWSFGRCHIASCRWVYCAIKKNAV